MTLLSSRLGASELPLHDIVAVTEKIVLAKDGKSGSPAGTPFQEIPVVDIPTMCSDNEAARLKRAAAEEEGKKVGVTVLGSSAVPFQT